MKNLSVIFCGFAIILISVLSEDVKDSEKSSTAMKNQVTTLRGSYYSPPHHRKPKYCYKTICKDYYRCKYIECNCKDIKYVCGCDKEESYYFKELKKSYHKGYGHGGYVFILKKVCLTRKLCDASKCEKCKTCGNVEKCYKHKYICGYYY